MEFTGSCQGDVCILKISNTCPDEHGAETNTTWYTQYNTGLASKVCGLYLWVWCEEIIAHWAGSINHLILVKLGHEIIPVIIVGLSLCLTVVCHQRGLGRKRGKEGKREGEGKKQKEKERGGRKEV